MNKIIFTYWNNILTKHSKTCYFCFLWYLTILFILQSLKSVIELKYKQNVFNISLDK